VLASFQSLGEEIESKWQEQNSSSDAFPEIAAKALEEFKLHDEFGEDTFTSLIEQHPSLPEQCAPNHFGTPPITVFRADGFYINLLHWFRAEPSIHDHAFNGAFTVLEGGSHQFQYEFKDYQEHANLIRVGVLESAGESALEMGDVQILLTGDKFVHQVWHLSAPTVSLVVRHDDDATTQLKYWPGGVAVGSNKLLQNNLLTRLVVFLSTLGLRGRDDEFEIFKRVLLGLPIAEAVFTLLRYLEASSDIELSMDILDELKKEHGEWLGACEGALIHTLNSNEIMPRWSLLQDEGRKFFLMKMLSNYEEEQLQESYGPLNIDAFLAETLPGSYWDVRRNV
jgi:hypothetical protein